MEGVGLRARSASLHKVNAERAFASAGNERSRVDWESLIAGCDVSDCDMGDWEMVEEKSAV